MKHLGRWRMTDAPGGRATRLDGSRDAAPPRLPANLESGEKEVTRLVPQGGGLWVGQDAAGRRVQVRKLGNDLELTRADDPPWQNQTGSGVAGDPAPVRLARPGADPERQGVAPSGARAVDLAAIRLDAGDASFGGVQHARLGAYQRYLDQHYGERSP